MIHVTELDAQRGRAGWGKGLGVAATGTVRPGSGGPAGVSR